MFQTIVIVILFIIIIYLILDKKNLKAEDVKSFLGKFCQKIKDVASLIYSRLKSCSAITNPSSVSQSTSSLFNPSGVILFP